MPSHKFCSIKSVPGYKEIIDIVLSKTLRHTPTVVNNGWSIGRIRRFYMRKLNFVRQMWNENLTNILEQFPKLEDIHPFYADLLNVLYDRDFYKLALGKLHMARKFIGKVMRDYIRLLKYGDSLYRCKKLKTAAIGRTCTSIKRMGVSLSYLEQIRQHMSRLPNIDTNLRTLLICGCPNVGKSSFMNKLTRAEVEVQPFAFTTKSLYLGHMDYDFLRWQVIDTPGILDRPFEDRNTIEMQSIVALIHLKVCILYIVDISEQCGYTIQQQADLYYSIKQLFNNKHVVIVCNKIDILSFSDLPDSSRDVINRMLSETTRVSIENMPDLERTEAPPLLCMSTHSEIGVMEVKSFACDSMLKTRIESNAQCNMIHNVFNRMYSAKLITTDLHTCAAILFIPREEGIRSDVGLCQRIEQELEVEQKKYQIANETSLYDVIPEISGSHNISDFVDEDIETKLASIEMEEELSSNPKSILELQTTQSSLYQQ